MAKSKQPQVIQRSKPTRSKPEDDEILDEPLEYLVERTRSSNATIERLSTAGGPLSGLGLSTSPS